MLDMGELIPKPTCDGMGRKETTELLNSELIRLRLTKKNAYSYWAHEVWLDRYRDEKIDNPSGYVAQRTGRARCLPYGVGKNGKPTFWE